MTSFYRQKWDKPYLTPSIAKTLLTKTPYHARLQCPYYGLTEDMPTNAMNEGRIVDCLVLGGDPGVTVLDYDEFRTKEARAARDAAVNPIKRADYDRCYTAANDVIDQISMNNHAAYEAMRGMGDIKKRLFWESEGVPCSAEPDIVNGHRVFDLKRTRIAPTMDNWARHVSRESMHIQVAATLEATGASKFSWICVEADPPHCVVVHPASPLMIQVGRRDWEYAKATWKNCVESDYFPAYESGEIDPTSWLVGERMDEENYAEDLD